MIILVWVVRQGLFLGGLTPEFSEVDLIEL